MGTSWMLQPEGFCVGELDVDSPKNPSGHTVPKIKYPKVCKSKKRNSVWSIELHWLSLNRQIQQRM